MNRTIASIVAGIATSVACATQPAAIPTPPPDGAPLQWSDGTSAAKACTRLQQLGCPLGNDPGCERTFSLPAGFGVDPQCVLSASGKPALASCNVTCQ